MKLRMLISATYLEDYKSVTKLDKASIVVMD